jgi:hypothetical protein
VLYFGVRLSGNTFLFLLPNMINVPNSVKYALSPKISNAEAKLFAEDSVIDFSIKGLIVPRTRLLN